MRWGGRPTRARFAPKATLSDRGATRRDGLIPEVTGESATSGQARDDHAASLLTLDLIRAADDAPSSDSPYPTSRTMRSFNG